MNQRTAQAIGYLLYEPQFVRWFRKRFDQNGRLEVKYYCDGEPYFSNEGAECSLRDYLQVIESERQQQLPLNPQPK